MALESCAADLKETCEWTGEQLATLDGLFEVTKFVCEDTLEGKTNGGAPFHCPCVKEMDQHT